MAGLSGRIRKLESNAPDRYYMPEAPRVAGRPREVAVAERIEWLERLLDHPQTQEANRSSIRHGIAQLQTLFPAAEDARQVWSDIWIRYPSDDFSANLERYMEFRPSEIRENRSKQP